MMITSSSQLDGFLKIIRIKDDDHPRFLVAVFLKTIRIKGLPYYKSKIDVVQYLNTVETHFDIYRTLSHVRQNGIMRIYSL
jgi:hypothetical protein